MFIVITLSWNAITCFLESRVEYEIVFCYYNRFVFVSWSWYLLCNGNQALVRR